MLIFAGYGLAAFATRTVPVQVLQGVESGYNFTVNSSGPSAINISNVTVTIPSGFSFVANSNRTTALAAHTFQNTSTVLIWNASGLIQNVSATRDFLFNATANSSSIGIFNITINMYNTTGIVNQTNFTVSVNDTQAPGLSVTLNDATDTKIVLDVALTDNDPAGIAKSCAILGGYSDSSVSGTGATQTITINALTCGTSYSIGAQCSDLANNTNSSTSSYTTDACEEVGGGGVSSGGSGSSGGFSWASTRSADDKDISEKGLVTQSLSERHRVRIEFNNEKHYIGVRELSNGVVTIEVTSTPQQAEMSAGQSKMFDLDNDGTYDLEVNVLTVEGSNVEISMRYVNVPVTTEEKETPAEEGSQGSEAGTGAEVAEGSSSMIIWIIVIVVILLAIGYYFWQRRR